MIRLLLAAIVVGFTAPAVVAQDKAADKAGKKAAKADGGAIGHMVYFKLKDPTPENKTKLVDACKKYLVEHEGVLYFAAGTLAEKLNREVNDRDWDVALHLVFVNQAAHDKYATHPEHLKFIEENKEMWAKVRVFDSEFTPVKKKKKDAAAK